MILNIASEYGFYCFTMFRVEYFDVTARASNCKSRLFSSNCDSLESSKLAIDILKEVPYTHDIAIERTQRGPTNWMKLGTVSDWNLDYCSRVCIISRLQSQLGSAPMTTLGVPLDGIICSHSNPLWQGTILSLGLGQSALGSKRLLRWLHIQ
jgi:hypothetical protein